MLPIYLGSDAMHPASYVGWNMGEGKMSHGRRWSMDLTLILLIYLVVSDVG